MIDMDLNDLYRLLRHAHEEAQGVVDTIRDPLLVLDSDLIVLSANPAFYRTFETTREETEDMPLSRLGNGQWNIEELDELLRKVIPKSASVFDYEVRANFPDIGLRFMLVSAQRLKHPDTGRRLILLSIVDDTVRRRKEDAKDLLVGEVHHRIKNLMAVTHSLARQTRTEGRTAEEYRDAFLGRFEALQRALDTLIPPKSSKLPDLARSVLEPFLGQRGRIAVADEPEVPLLPGQALPLGMILHELATNALKHGALSVPEGKVTLEWAVAEPIGDVAPEVRLRWTESGGPATSPPTEAGFGTRLIQFVAQQDLGGGVELLYEPRGLVAEISYPQG